MSFFLDSILNNNNIQMCIGYDNTNADNEDLYRKSLYKHNIILYDKKFVIQKNTWISGTTIPTYPDSNSIRLVDNKVYICIQNNDSVSTIKPTSKSLFNFRLDDGYVWRYLYTIQDDTIKDFISINNVRRNTVVINGSILNVEFDKTIKFTNPKYYFITKNGIGASLNYKLDGGNIQYLYVSNGGNSYKKDDILVMTDDATGNGGSIKLDIDSGKISVNSFIPGGNYIAPKAYIIGDGKDAEIELVIKNGSIDSVNVINAGTNYTRAEVIIVNSKNSFIGRVQLETKNSFGFIGSLQDINSKLLISKVFKVDIDTKINYVMLTSIPLKNEIPEIYLVNSIDKNLSPNSENTIQMLLEEA